MWQTARSPVLCWRVTVASSGLALLLAQLLGPSFEALSFLAFLAAVGVSAWYGGLWPGLLASAFGLAGSWYLLFGTEAMANEEPGAALGLGGFLAMSVLISVLMARLHAAGRPAAWDEAGPIAEGAIGAGPASRPASAGADGDLAGPLAPRAPVLNGNGALGSEWSAVIRDGRNGGLDLGELDALAQMAVPRLGDWCAIDVVQADGTSHRLVTAHAVGDELAEQLRRRFPLAPPRPCAPLRIVRDETEAAAHPPDPATLVGRARAVLDELNLASALIMPLAKDGRTLGSLALVSADLDRSANAERRILAAEVAARAAVLLENVRLRDDLKASRAYLGGILAATSEALLVIDSDWRYVEANPAAAALFGLPRGALARLRVGDLPVLGDPWTAAERARFVREGRWEGRMDVRRAGGATLTVDVRVTAVVLSDDTIYVAALREAEGRPPLALP